MRIVQSFLTTTAVALCLLTSPTAARAQEQDGSALEEIIVTSQRRAQSVQDIPIAVSAFTADELEARNIVEALDIVQHVPNLIGHNNVGIGTANTYFIRAVGNTESIATFDPPVGTYIDDIYISRQNANNFAFFDMERVEVLRGPQGTLFGRNTTGGAVRLLLKKPGEEVSGFAEASYGRFDEVRLRGSIDLPAHEKVRTKVSAYYVTDDGFTQNINTGDRINDEENYGVRAAAQVLPNDTLTWNISFAFVNHDETNVPSTPTSGKKVPAASGNFSFSLPALTNAGSVSTPRFANTGVRKAPLEGSLIQQYLNGGGPLFNRTRTYLWTSNLQMEFEDVSVEVITGFVDLTQKFALDFFDGAIFGASPFGTFTIANEGSHEQFSQEIKAHGSLGGGFIDYVAGVYYINERNDTRFAQVNSFRLFNPVHAGSILEYDRLLENDTEAGAGYIQLDWNFTDQLTVTTGIRYTDETKELEVRHFTDVNPALIGPTTARFTTPDLAAAGIPDELNTTIWTPRFAVQYAVHDDLLVFASATRGFKSGGWNARGVNASQIQDFRQEKNWTYEAGFKSEWFDNRLRFNVTGFYSDTTDFQLPSAFNDASGALVFLTRNFADLEVIGAEFELNGSLNEYISAYSTLGLQDADYKNLNAAIISQQQDCLNGLPVCGQGIITPEGSIAEPVRAADVTWTTGFNSAFPIGFGDAEIVANGNMQYVGDYTVSTSNTPEGDTGNHWIANASVGIQAADQRWGVYAECNNCFGELYVTSALAGFVYFNDPASWRIRTKFRF